MQNKINSLIHSMQCGNLAVFDEFYQRTYRLFYVVAFGVLRDKELTEEVVQDSYVAIYKNLDKIDVDGNVMSYLYTIVKNKSLSVLRKRVDALDIQDEAVEFLLGDKNMKPHKDSDILSDCRGVLNEQEYEVLVMSLVKGYKRREIAQILDSNINTVSWRYSQAIKKLKHHLKEENYANR